MYPTDLITLLEKYRPADPREAEFLRQMQALLAQPRPCARSSVAPGHFTVSAFVLSPDHARVALIYHPKFRRWLQPGGHLEPQDPTLDAAARREIAEELGITDLTQVGGLFDIDVHDIPAGKEPAHLHFDLRLRYTAHTLPLTGEHPGQWVPLGEVEGVDTDPSVLRGVGKLRGRGEGQREDREDAALG